MKKALFKLLLFVVMVACPVIARASGGISISPTSLTVDVGKTRTFTITAINTHGSVTLSSSDSSVAVINTNSWETGEIESGQTVSTTITVTGVSEGSATIAINIDATTFDNEVLSPERTVTVVVKNVSSNNNLSSLKVDDESVPNFSPSLTTYNIETAKASINIAATAEDTKATIAGTGNKTLKYGKNSYEVKVTAENGSVKTYTVNVTRNDTRDTNNYLKSLSTNIGTISFNKDTLKYTLDVGNDVEKIVVSAEAESDKAKVTGTGEKTLKYGENKLEVKVTAENETQRTYVITVVREDNRDNNCYLSNLSVDRGSINFSKDVLSYTLTVQPDVETLVVSAVADSVNAKVTGDGEKALKVGTNKIEIKVTAENETVKIYTLTVTRLEKDDTKYIKYLTIDNADFEFDPDTLSYEIALGDEQTELNINYELEEGVLASLEGNENLSNGSIVILKVSKGERFKEYTFSIRKSVPVTPEPTKTKKTGGNKWIIIGAIVLVLLAVIGSIANKKKKKKPEPESAEIPTLDGMGTTLTSNEGVTDSTLYTTEPQSTAEVNANNEVVQNMQPMDQTAQATQPMNDVNQLNNPNPQEVENNNVDNLGI